MSFWDKVAKIWNQPACEVKQGWWSEQCANRRTWWTVITEIFGLCWEMVWLYLYAVTTVVVISVGIYKIIRYKRELRELSEQIGRTQVQIQQQNTNVIVQSNKNPRVERTTTNTHHGDIEMATFNPDESSSTSFERCKVCNSQSHRSKNCQAINRGKEFQASRTNKCFEQEASDGGDESESESSSKESVVREEKSKKERGSEKRKSWSRTNGGRLTRKTSKTSNESEDESPSVLTGYPAHVRFSDESERASQSSFRQEAETSFANYHTVPQQGFRVDRRGEEQIIHVSTTSNINFPAPNKFTREANVHDWIKDMDLYIAVTGVRERKKTLFWAYLDAETRNMLSDINFDDDDEYATSQLKNKLVELFGQGQKAPLELIKEFSDRKQRPGENVRIYCLELQSLCKRAFTDCLNHERYIIDQFVEGVGNKALQLSFYSNPPRSVSQMLDIASKYESGFIKQNERNRRNGGQPGSSNAFPEQQQTQADGQHGAGQQQQQGYQPRRFGNCFVCGSSDHMKPDCPRRNQTQGQSGQASNGQQAATHVQGV